MMKRNTRSANSANAVTVLLVSGAVLLTIVPIGHVVVSGQPTGIGDQASGEKVSPSTSQRSEGRRLFRTETFGGNGRTCETCHSPSDWDTLAG